MANQLSNICNKKWPRIAYIETLKTDFDRIIYNCGGVVGLWFGLTLSKAAECLKFLPPILKTMKSKSIKSVHKLKAIKMLQNICKFFVTNLH
jgi:hypothetical protein